MNGHRLGFFTFWGMEGVLLSATCTGRENTCSSASPKRGQLRLRTAVDVRVGVGEGALGGWSERKPTPLMPKPEHLPSKPLNFPFFPSDLGKKGAGPLRAEVAVHCGIA